ncbi:hypothetical protein [Agrococcus sp. HG114]|uniref:hypothetical protein n=1 Tax=Agrococcus sp. HG114 TaxID=2969757 RepID=UPI00215B380F|nr:hypothetical protein [Agrococcus sp. HG114]MCR8670926.1 hypothetical protein [Agrococcus sp. HG114]
MDARRTRGRPVAIVCGQVAVVVVLHAAATAAVVAANGYTAERVGPVPVYWAVVTLLPSLLWVALVVCRAAAWRRASNFWLAGAAGVVSMLAFIAALVLRISPVHLPGVGFGMLVSSWMLAGVALAVAIMSNAISRAARHPEEGVPEPE